MKEKTTTFYSAWNQYPARLDTSMTRVRAALLMRTWRRNSRKNTNNPKWVFKRVAPHTYFVKTRDYDLESHTLIIGDIV